MSDSNEWGVDDGAKQVDTRTYVPIRNTKVDGRQVCGFFFPSFEGNERAKKIEIVNKKTEEITIKWEIPFQELKNVKIVGVKFADLETKDGNKFTNLNVDLESATKKVVTLSLPFRGNFAQDFLKKLPALDLDVTFDIKPYDFEDKERNNKRVTGLSIVQNDKKIVSFFNVYDEEGKRTNVVMHDFPEAKPLNEVYEMTAPRQEAYWKTYFGEVALFLREYTEKYILPKYVSSNGSSHPDIADEVGGDEPF